MCRWNVRSDPSSTEGLAGTSGDNSGFGDKGPTNEARDQCSHTGMRQSEGEEGPSRRTVSWSIKGNRRPIDKRTSSSLRVILGIAIYNSRVYTIITFLLEAQMNYSQTDLASLKGVHGVLVLVFLVTVGRNGQKNDTAFPFLQMSARVENFSRASK